MPDSTALTRFGTRYVAKKKLFNFLGQAFRIFDNSGQLCFFVKQKAFKLKEQITVYADESQKDAVLGIQARQMMDISATYDVTDSASGEKVGAMKRKGMKSLFRDEWSILDTNDAEIGLVKEDAGFLAIIRRLFLKFLPQTYHVTVGEQMVGKVKQRFNPFILSYDVDFDSAPEGALDRRMMVAMVVLLLAIEGRQR